MEDKKINIRDIFEYGYYDEDMKKFVVLSEEKILNLFNADEIILE